jgi:outer membrane assembly lipoprotein YfiO
MGWIPFSFAVGCLLCSSLARAEPKAWQLGDSGRWTQSPTTTKSDGPVVNPFLDRAQQLFNSRDYQFVHDILLDWLLKNPKAPDRPRALLLMAQTYFELGDRLECFYQGDELIDNYPDSKLFFPTLELQYRVADAYLSGYKNKFLGLRIVPMDDTAIEMLFRIQERAPGSPLAEKALARSADFYYRTSQFDLAADAYGAFVRIYPRSNEVARARLRQAYSNFAQFRGPRYDGTPLLDARTQFLGIQARDPELAREEGVQQFIDRIDEQLAAKLVVNAQYYERVGEPKAAVFVYRSLVQRYPASREAVAARKILEKMPASTLTDPWPPQSAAQLPAPTTRPTFDVK